MYAFTTFSICSVTADTSSYSFFDRYSLDNLTQLAPNRNIMLATRVREALQLDALSETVDMGAA
jgi:hypothetical protein